MARVRLLGMDDIVHAEGDIPAEAAANAGWLVRNERPYRFIGFAGDRILKFQETPQPYIITEF